MAPPTDGGDRKPSNAMLLAPFLFTNALFGLLYWYLGRKEQQETEQMLKDELGEDDMDLEKDVRTTLVETKRAREQKQQKGRQTGMQAFVHIPGDNPDADTGKVQLDEIHFTLRFLSHRYAGYIDIVLQPTSCHVVDSCDREVSYEQRVDKIGYKGDPYTAIEEYMQSEHTARFLMYKGAWIFDTQHISDVLKNEDTVTTQVPLHGVIPKYYNPDASAADKNFNNLIYMLSRYPVNYVSYLVYGDLACQDADIQVTQLRKVFSISEEPGLDNFIVRVNESVRAVQIFMETYSSDLENIDTKSILLRIAFQCLINYLTSLHHVLLEKSSGTRIIHMHEYEYNGEWYTSSLSELSKMVEHSDDSDVVYDMLGSKMELQTMKNMPGSGGINRQILEAHGWKTRETNGCLVWDSRVMMKEFPMLDSARTVFNITDSAYKEDDNESAFEQFYIAKNGSLGCVVSLKVATMLDEFLHKSLQPNDWKPLHKPSYDDIVDRMIAVYDMVERILGSSEDIQENT